MEKKVEEIQSGIQAMNIQKCPEVVEIQSGIHAMNIHKCPDVEEIQSGIHAMNIQKCPEVEEIQSGIQAMNIQKCPEVEHIHDCIETRSILNGCDSLDIEFLPTRIQQDDSEVPKLKRYKLFALRQEEIVEFCCLWHVWVTLERSVCSGDSPASSTHAREHNGKFGQSTMSLVHDQRVALLEAYFTEKSYQRVIQLFQVKFPNAPLPGKTTVYDLVQGFRDRGCVKDRFRSGRPSVLTPEFTNSVQHNL
ncbi:unnamed protein product [Timema podura]|uniref:DUF4817 domain-containing protein n=1 Tax=Timema podura TaxID=61482 RepID=A0ABN7NL50_TIMPD|nr:unnamed protein product [Timema podura]